MQISFKGDYALKLIVDLAMHYPDTVVTVKDVSRRQDIPPRFLEQIVVALKAAGYIRTTRGARGGLALAKAPSAITLGEIIRLIDGPTAPIACVSGSCRTRCDFEGRCALRGVFARVRESTNAIVDHTTVQDMADQTRAFAGGAEPEYAI